MIGCALLRGCRCSDFRSRGNCRVLVRLGHVADGRTMFCADARRDGKCFVAHADEMLTAFVELERAIRCVSGEALSGNWGLPD